MVNKAVKIVQNKNHSINYEYYRELANMLDDVSKAIYVLRKREILGHKLSALQWTILYTSVELAGKATVANIAKKVMGSSSSISQVVSRMEKHGLVKKVKHTKNQMLVVLTDKGMKIHNKASEAYSFVNIFSSLSDEQQQQLRTILKILFNTTQQELIKYHIAKFKQNIWSQHLVE